MRPPAPPAGVFILYDLPKFTMAGPSPHGRAYRAVRGAATQQLHVRAAKESSYSLTLKIVAGRRMTEFRPALGAPVFDVAGFTHEGLEAFGLSHGGVGGMPEERIVGATGDVKAGFSPLFKWLKSPKGSAHVKVDKPQDAQSRKALGRGGFGGGTAQQTRGRRQPFCGKVRRRSNPL